jgi:hypothetical protein
VNVIKHPHESTQMRLSQLAELRGRHPDHIRRLIDNVIFIAEHYRAKEMENQVDINEINKFA